MSNNNDFNNQGNMGDSNTPNNQGYQMSSTAGYPYQQQIEEPKKKGLAIASLVCGIVSWVTCGPLTSIPGIILAIPALIGKKQGGKGIAIAGLIISIINLILYVFLTIFMFIPMFNYMLNDEPLPDYLEGFQGQLDEAMKEQGISPSSNASFFIGDNEIIF